MTPIRHAGLMTKYLHRLHGSINLAFHDIVRAPEELRTEYDVRLRSFTEIVDRCRRLGIAGRVRLYFDDNHRSLYGNIVGEVDVSDFQEIVAAVPLTSLGSDGRGTLADVEHARSAGVRIVPHGYSHVRLASYDSRGNLLSGLYDVLTTSDFEVDVGQELRPRLLVKATDTAHDIERRILKEVTAA